MAPRKRKERVHDHKIIGRIDKFQIDDEGLHVTGFLTNPMDFSSPIRPMSFDYSMEPKRMSINYIRAALAWVMAIIAVVVFLGAFTVERVYRRIRALHK